MVDLYPKVCNICSGRVEYMSNAYIYGGKEYGSGRCYCCKSCGAYVGTHEGRREEALGLLADSRMRKGKIMCHEIFDKQWKGKRQAKIKRERAYRNLAQELNIDIKDCHFGHFDLEMLRKAYKILIKADTLGEK